MEMIINIIAGILGILFQMFARMDSIRKDFKAAKQEFVLRKFFRDDWMAIAGSFTFLLIMAITANEFLVWKPELQKYQRLLFTMGGAIGSWAFAHFLGRSKKYIRNIIDTKTNTTDDKSDNQFS